MTPSVRMRNRLRAGLMLVIGACALRGVTDRYAYMGDSLNRRLLRAKIVYSADESVEIK